MPKKTKTIFTITFIITLLGAVLIYLWINKDKGTNEGEESPWYQEFNPFGTSATKESSSETEKSEKENEIAIEKPSENSKFLKITDFAIAGATFIQENRLKENILNNEIKQTTEIISSNTLNGRKEIQEFLNKELSLNPPLTIDGVLGKKATQAIIEFQKLKGLETTGKIDEKTAPYFTKTIIVEALVDEDKYEKAPTLRFVERKNGHIYKMFLDKKTRERISNSTIPTIYEALFNNTGDTVIYRNLSDNKINSFMATQGESVGEFLPENILNLSISKDQTKFFYLTKNQNGVVGTIRNFGENKREIIFEHPFTEWLSEWDNNNNIYLTTKASYGVSGSIFLLNPMNKTINKIFGGINGLTTLINKTGKSILYSYSTGTGPKLGIFKIKDRSNIELDVYGLAEKCVWSNSGIILYCAIPNNITTREEPDSWYKGLTSFTDSFISINTETGDKQLIANSEKEIPIDAFNLFLDKEENTIFFTNKKDSSLWSLQIN